MAVEVFVNAVDLTTKYELSSLSIRNSGLQGIAVCDVTIIDNPAGAVVNPEHVLRVLDGGVEVFEGKIKQRLRRATPDPGPNPVKVYEVSAQDYTHLLTQDVIDTTLLRTGSRTDKAEVEYVVNTFGTKGITVGATVQNTGTITRDIDYSGMNLYEALEEAGKWLGIGFYVDANLVLHWFVTEANAAPFNLSDTPNDVTTFGYRNLNLNADTVELVNAVWVVGTEIAQWETDAASIALYGRIETTLRDPEITTAAEATAAGQGFLATRAYPVEPITLKLFTPGLKAGMTIQLTNSLWAIAAVTYRIVEVLTKHNEATPGLVYSVSLDSRPVNLTDLLLGAQRQAVASGSALAGAASSLATLPVDLSVAGANLVRNSSFESGSAGSWTVGALWTFGFDPVSPQEPFHGSKVARLVGVGADSGAMFTPLMPVARTDFYWMSVWSFLRARTAGDYVIYIEQYSAAAVVVDATLITLTAAETEWTRHAVRFGPNDQTPGTVVWNAATTQVRIGFFAVSSPVGTWDVDGVQLERGALVTAYAPSPQELVDLQITSTQIADDAVTTPKLVANAVVAGKIAAGSVTADKLAVGSVEADKMSVGARGPTNLVLNGSFEDGTLNNGTVYGWFPGGTCNIVAGGNSGANCASLNGVSGAYTASIISNRFAVRPGDTVYVSAFSKAIAGNGSVEIYVVYYTTMSHGSGTQVAAHLVASRSTGGVISFVESNGTSVVPALAVAAYVQIYNSVGSTIIGIDDVVARTGDQLVTADGNVRITSSGVAVTGGKINVVGLNGQVTIDDGEIAANSVVISAMARKGPNLIDNSSFEFPPVVGLGVPFAAATDARPHWLSGTVGCIQFAANATSATSGNNILRIAGNGAAAFPAINSYSIPVSPGKTYRLSARGRRAGGAINGRIRIDTRDRNDAAVSSDVAGFAISSTAAVPAYLEVTYTVPADGTVSYLRVLAFLNGALPAATDVLHIDDIELVEVPTGLINTPATTVINENGVTITNGALTVTNAGSTVIIDGTSNMFKIAATGTLSRAVAASTNSSTSVTLTGLAVAGVAPQMMASGAWNAGGITGGMLSVVTDPGFAFTAPTSGASPTLRAVVGQTAAYWYCTVVGADALVQIMGYNSTVGSKTVAGRYYVMKEAAL